MDLLDKNIKDLYALNTRIIEVEKQTPNDAVRLKVLYKARRNLVDAIREMQRGQIDWIQRFPKIGSEGGRLV